MLGCARKMGHKIPPNKSSVCGGESGEMPQNKDGRILVVVEAGQFMTIPFVLYMLVNFLNRMFKFAN